MKTIKGELELDKERGVIWFNDENGMCRLRISGLARDVIEQQFIDLTLTPEELAKFFHEKYEELAPKFGYKTREESAVAWESVPENNRKLMVAVAREVITKFLKED